MATSDLLNELPKDTFRLDADGERRVCQARKQRGGQAASERGAVASGPVPHVLRQRKRARTT